MKHNLIKTDNYLLVVDDSEIKVGDYVVSGTSTIVQCMHPYNIVDRDIKKIIAHLPLNGAPVLEGVDALPPLEDEVEKLANEYTKNEKHSGWWAFLRGYNKAKEKYKYTEEDLRKAFNAGDNFRYYQNGGFMSIPSDVLDEDDYIQSLRQPKLPIAFECEMELIGNVGEKQFYNIKTITNSEGRTEWVGKYIYE